MIGDKRTKRLKEKRHRDAVIDEARYLDAVEDLARKAHMEDTFIVPYEDDPSIGGMYQRKKKKTKSKSKRKKRCKK